MKYNFKKSITVLIVFLLMICTTSYAHSGRTDSNGGHRDNQNKSGLGSYHYHCGGHPAHLYTNGVCPYSSSSSSSKKSSGSKTKSSSSSKTTTSSSTNNIINNNGGILNITGSVTTENINTSTISISNNGKVTINGGTVTGSGSNTIALGSGQSQGGELTLISGSVKNIATDSEKNSANDSTKVAIYADNNSKVNISGGTVTGLTGIDLVGTSTINASGGTITGESRTAVVINSSSGSNTISNTTINGTTYGVYNVNSNLAITGGNIKITNANPRHIEPILNKLEETSCKIITQNNEIEIIAPRRLKAVDIKTMPYPGFPTDLQSIFTALLTHAKGTSIVTENIFESRYKYTQELNRMGAKIKVEGRTAIVKGTKKIQGANIEATDLRGGAALVLAALAAKSETQILNVHYILRGYENMEQKLKKIGADIHIED